MPLYLETSIIATKQRKSHTRTLLHQHLQWLVCHFKWLIDTGTHTKTLTHKMGEPRYNEADFYQKCNRWKHNW
jgi:hypothetical protein